MPLLFTFLFLFILETSFAVEYKFIHNADELIKFSYDVTNGNPHTDYNVYLVSDIVFNEEQSQQFIPIGTTGSLSFKGTFDGQGYVIRNLTMNSASYPYFGVFGISYGGATIGNFVLDDSCSFTSSYTGSSSYTTLAAMIGYCYSRAKACTLVNFISMANLSYIGTRVSSNLYIGAVAGLITIADNVHTFSTINCINYGTIYNMGGSSELLYGGIIGDVYASVANYKDYILNCLNYGTIINDGSGSLMIGGILGLSHGSTLMNCVSAGNIINNKGTAQGSLVGSTRYYTLTVDHSYWTEDTGCTNHNFGTNTYMITIDSNSTDTLNDLAVNNGWNEWAFNQNNASITFRMNNGEGYSLSYPLILLPNPLKRGYTFLFWCVNEDLNEDCKIKYNRSETNFTEPTTLYAQWSSNNCTVYFDPNEGDDLPEDEVNITTAFDQKFGSSLITPTRRGYTFVGWYTKYEELVTSESPNTMCDYILYAYWTLSNFTVTFDVNGGDELSEDMKNITVTFSTEYEKLLSPNRDGFSFIGWFNDDNVEITNKTIVNITTNIVLHAQWKANEYTVTLNVNGGDELPADKAEVTIPSDKAFELLAKPTRRGYTFIGWFTEDDAPITNETATTGIVTKNQILYAHWRANIYTVTFDENGGDELTEYEDGVRVTFDDTYKDLPKPNRTGYRFDGWLSDGNELITNESTVNITSDCTLHANWTAETFTVKFDVNGGNELTEITVTYDGNYTCLPTPEKEGYTFLWWYIKGTKEIIYNVTRVGTACDHVLCAAWNRNTIIFDVNGGEELGEKEKEVIYNDVYTSLPMPTRRGYEFDGWFTNDGDAIEEGSIINITYDQTISAKWTPNKYTMKLDVNGGDALVKNNITVTYDGPYGYIPTPTRTGYTFIGWYTENNELVTIDVIVKDACHCTLIANWTADLFVIIFDPKGGELSDDETNITVTYDDIYGYLPIPIKTGHIFNGWYTEDNIEITINTKVTTTTNQILYARWTEISAPSKYVEIVFGKGNMTEEEIREILGKFTNAEFDIINIESDKPGETTVIIRFNDVEDAEKFLTAFSESDDSARYFIRSVNFNSKIDVSFSAMIYPFVLFNILLD